MFLNRPAIDTGGAIELKKMEIISISLSLLSDLFLILNKN